MSELRFNPILGEWLATATHRQERTFMPPPDFCPLCPTQPGGFPTEVPEDDYDVVVFENKFPSLKSEPEEPSIASTDLFPVSPSKGVCEVVLYSPDHKTSLAAEPVEKYYKLVKVWRHRTEALDALDFVKYVFIFENKGEAVGVTLHHPHGQIYAYPFVPPIIEKEFQNAEHHFREHGECLFCSIIAREVADEDRIITRNDTFVAFIPFFARYPFEVHILPQRHFGSFADLSPEEEIGLAEILKQVITAFDRIFDAPFPYVMAIHQRPSDGDGHEFYHFHIEFYPPMRTAAKLKYLAGSEIGAGMYINDTLPETKALELRELISPIEWKT